MYFDTDVITKFLRPFSIRKLAQSNRVMQKARTLVSAYYYFLPFVAFLFANNPVIGRENFEPFWPIAWVQLVGLEYETVAITLKLAFIVVALIAVFLHRHRVPRFLVFLVLLHVQAFESSFGNVNHQWYLWLYTSLIFTFLPDIWSIRTPSRDRKQVFLMHIWLAQALAMLTYTMAGMWKFIISAHQFFLGEVHGFSVHAFAYQIANWTTRLQEEAVLAPYIIHYPELGWPFYVGVHFLQLFAIWTVVRPSLQKFWALMLVLFHIGTYLTMGISFHPLIILIIILFFFSPFTPEHVSVRQFIRDLPILTHLVYWMERKRNKPFSL